MTISRVELQGQTMRAQDFTNIKHNEDTKVMVDQSNIGQHATQEVDNKLHQVNQMEESNNREKRFDARDKGSNEYSGDGGKNRKKKESDGKVFIKGREPHEFDFKI